MPNGTTFSSTFCFWEHAQDDEPIYRGTIQHCTHLLSNQNGSIEATPHHHPRPAGPSRSSLPKTRRALRQFSLKQVRPIPANDQTRKKVAQCEKESRLNPMGGLQGSILCPTSYRRGKKRPSTMAVKSSYHMKVFSVESSRIAPTESKSRQLPERDGLQPPSTSSTAFETRSVIFSRESRSVAARD